ncbi:MAG: DUF169 domain-containing protein [Tissierellales bacterium]|jgi:uncharacterized protein (DUF169 family)|nr:DUF169 domain-containing protein [Tissierellales bacterium]
MPFKHEKIKYGFVQDEFDSELLKNYCEDLDCALNFERKPVGVKLYFTEEDYKNEEWEEPRGKQSYCCMVEKATRGRMMKTRLEHHNCDGATTAFHLEESSERIESGMEYFSYNLYKTPAAARRMRSSVPGLYRTGAKTYGMAIGPLENFTKTPDIVVFIVNPYQTMRLQQGYVYKDGKRLIHTGASMQALCVEASVEPYMFGRMNITPMCPSTRMLAKWADHEMAVGLPYEYFESTVEGVIATIGTTDLKKRKEEITERFLSKNKKINIPSYEY